MKKNLELKYSKDAGPKLAIGDFVERLGLLIVAGADDDQLGNYIDHEFLWGAWKDVLEGNMKPNLLFAADIRGTIVDAYRQGVVCGYNRNGATIPGVIRTP